METTLIKKRTETSPRVYFDSENSIFEISGISRPENAVSFYQSLIDFINENYQNIENDLVCELKFLYMNTISEKMVYHLLETVDKKINTLGSVLILWKHLEKDKEMLEIGKNYEDLLPNLTFEFIEITEN